MENPLVTQFTQTHRPHTKAPLRQAILLQPPVQSTAAEAQGFGGAIGVAAKSRQCFFDEQTFHLFQTHFIDSRRHSGITARLQGEIKRGHNAARRHQRRSFNYMVQFANVSRPRMLHEGIDRSGAKALELPSIAIAMLPQEMLCERTDVFPAFTQRGKVNLYGVETKNVRLLCGFWMNRPAQTPRFPALAAIWLAGLAAHSLSRPGITCLHLPVQTVPRGPP